MKLILYVMLKFFISTHLNSPLSSQPLSHDIIDVSLYVRWKMSLLMTWIMHMKFMKIYWVSTGILW